MDCLGYGTIHFQQRKSAMQAVKNLGGLGYHIRLSEAPELDESNIYFSHLPRDMTEIALKDLVSPFAPVRTARILRDGTRSTGTGFTRLQSAAYAVNVIRNLNGLFLPGCTIPIEVRLAFKAPSVMKLYQNVRCQDVLKKRLRYTSDDTGRVIWSFPVDDDDRTPHYGLHGHSEIEMPWKELLAIPASKGRQKFGDELCGMMLPKEYEDFQAVRVSWMFYEDSELLVPIVCYKEQDVLPLIGVYDSEMNIYFGVPYEPDEAQLQREGIEVSSFTLDGDGENKICVPKIPATFFFLPPHEYLDAQPSAVVWFKDGETFVPLVFYPELPPLKASWNDHWNAYAPAGDPPARIDPPVFVVNLAKRTLHSGDQRPL
ncbi:unnamed protein product [Cyprideis torosa]|uniref:Uncharacterized protein n=1 Tax=Cyprideis torosa TaxID=163714 RepID=A0A7R8W3X5_9CRUS|nr:unnamed protein product [Cyprideis torosa]CAG0883412.1 unnamed protein product [Cyprideis torosa]